MFSSPQLQQILLGYIPSPQLELVLVMFVVPFIVNVRDASAVLGGLVWRLQCTLMGEHRDWLGTASKCWDRVEGCVKKSVSHKSVTATVSHPFF